MIVAFLATAGVGLPSFAEAKGKGKCGKKKGKGKKRGHGAR